jgi:hypothetical protein
MRELEITPRMAKVLKIFLEDPGQPRYGFELMKLSSRPPRQGRPYGPSHAIGYVDP